MGSTQRSITWQIVCNRSYILAEVAPTYQQPNPSRRTSKKIAMTSLKRMGLYYPERQTYREHRVIKN